MYRVDLDENAQEELQRRTREKECRWRERDRLEMVRLSSAGWSIPQIARHLGIGEPRVRYWIKRFLADGFEALWDRPRPGKTSSLTPELMASLKGEIAKGERTWTARQLAEWLSETHGVRLSVVQLSFLLRREQLVWKRTSRSVEHKQDPKEVEVITADLETLEKGGRGVDRSLPPG